MAMIDIVFLIVGAISGFGFGYIFAGRKMVSRDQFEANELEKRLLQDKMLQLTKEAAEAKTFKTAREEISTEARTQFENLAHQILDLKAKKMDETQESRLKSMLDPLNEKLKEFQHKVEETYSFEARERHALKYEVQRMMELNVKMSEETTQLTRALKGDSKVQGDWGEMILERVLQASGLRRDIEYTVQKEYKDDDGQKYKPDVIVQLPEEKHIIIDSKVSLKAYELYMKADSDESKKLHLMAHTKSMRDHVQELSDKHYSKLKGLRSPDFVFMFVPIESAYMSVMEGDPDFTLRAWEKGVALVTATTLFTNLRTVASIWKLENQNQNSLEIAQEGGRIYDKLKAFVDDFENVGKQLERSLETHQTAFRKLSIGPGNVLRRAERLRELGASPKTRIRGELLGNENSDSDSESEKSDDSGSEL